MRPTWNADTLIAPAGVGATVYTRAYPAEGPVEVLNLFGRQGERIHLRAASGNRNDQLRDG